MADLQEEEKSGDMELVQAMGMVDSRIGEASLDILCYLESTAGVGNKDSTAR